MNLAIHPTAEMVNAAATELVATWLRNPDVSRIMLAAGNTPLELYRRIPQLRLSLKHLTIYALDEYVGVPVDEPRNCANLIRRTAVEPWGVPGNQYFTISSAEEHALASVRAHEEHIHQHGGLDFIVLGLGQNGHLGFNEPGSAEDSNARMLDLDPISVEANRQWFNGQYAPSRGVTVGMKTILRAKRVLVMAYGPHKAAAVAAMKSGPRTPACPASLLQGHPNVHVLVDAAAAACLPNPTS
jgi:glucosamine-6-phosphate deaminase